MKTLGLRTHTHVCIRKLDVCVRKHRPMYITKVPKIMKDKFFSIKCEI